MSEKIMTKETRESISAILALLSSCLIQNGVSMGYNMEDNVLIFFDTDIYLEEKRFSGFAIPIEKLVR